MTVEGDDIQIARQALERACRDAHEAHLAPLRDDELATPWGLDAASLRLLVTLVRALSPRHVLELGTGVSTRLLCHHAAQASPPFALSAIDHDPRFAPAAQHVTAAAASDGVPARCAIAALVAREFAERWLPAYHVSWRELASEAPIDLALIDGPPAALGGREGTLYQLMAFARPGTLVLLDDAHRPAERTALRHWTDNFGPAIERLDWPGLPGSLAALLIHRPVLADALWEHRVQLTLDDLASHVPDDALVAIIDDATWDPARVAPCTAVTFTDHGGAPADDTEALAALDRLRQDDVHHVAVTWAGFWWLEQYPALRRRLEDQAACLARNERVVIYRLNTSSAVEVTRTDAAARSNA